MDWNLIAIMVVCAVLGAAALALFLMSRPDEECDPTIENADRLIKQIESEIKELKK